MGAPWAAGYLPGSRSQGEKGWWLETRPDARGQWKPLEEPGSLTCPGAAVCSGPSLRCSGSALTNRCGRGCSVTRALHAVPVCPALLGCLPRWARALGGASPGEPHALECVCPREPHRLLGACPGELQNPGGACPREPHALGGVCELVSSLCSWHGAALHLPHGPHWGETKQGEISSP